MLLWILDWLQCAADWGRPQHSTCAPEKNQAAYYFLFYFLIFSKHETLKTLHKACILWHIKSEVSCKGTIHKPFCSHTVHLRCKKWMCSGLIFSLVDWNIVTCRAPWHGNTIVCCDGHCRNIALFFQVVKMHPTGLSQKEYYAQCVDVFLDIWIHYEIYQSILHAMMSNSWHKKRWAFTGRP